MISLHPLRAAFGFLLVACAIAIALPSQVNAASSRRAGGDPSSALSIHVKGNQLVNGDEQPVRLLGVDIDGTETACVQGRRIWQAPVNKHLARTIAQWGANVVRIPLNEDCWLGINGLPRRYSSARYQRGIEHLVNNLNAVGLVAILDLQWSAPGTIPATNLWPMPDASHAVLFWKSVATAFKAHPNVVFDLFNEPALGLKHPTQSDWACWRNGCTAQVSACSQNRNQGCAPTTFQVAGMQQLLTAVRTAGARQPVMAGGLNWAGDPCGVTDVGHNKRTCMWLKYRPSDPDHQLIASFHTYNSTACHNVACWNASVAPVARQVPLITGELGEKACSTTYVTSYMRWADQHRISYLIWSWNLPAAGQTCAQQGTRLITDWDGELNSASPVAAAVQSHLREELRRQGVHP